MVWVAWDRNGKSSVAHASAEVRVDDITVGSFPLECGRWAPDAWDVERVYVVSAHGYTPGRACRSCIRATEVRP